MKDLIFDLQRFAGGTYPTDAGAGNASFQMNLNRTDDSGLSPEMRTYYSDYILDNAEPRLVHSQFGQKFRITRGSGDTIEWRKYDPYPKALTPLTEGVTPNGRKMTMTTVKATARQYGDFTALTDRVLTEHPDNHLIQATKLHGSQAGRTLDTITREVINGGTNVQFGEDAVLARHLLVGGQSSGNHYLTVDCIRRAVRRLKKANAEPINGSFVGIINEDASYDLRKDPLWRNPKEYCDPQDLYEGEIGMIEGVRFVETTEAKIFHAEDLSATARTLKVSDATVNAGVVKVTKNPSGALSSADAAALIGRYVLINNTKFYVSAATTTSITIKTGPEDGAANGAPTVTTSTIIYPGEAGKDGRDVYSTLILADNAYGDVELDGESLQNIVKQLGSGGTSDPLNQRATAGWKATKTAARLVEAFMVRIETCSTFEGGAN